MATSAAKAAKIQTLINDLSNSDVTVRSKAVSALGRYTTDPSIIRDLTMALTDESAAVRKRVVKALGDNKHAIQAFLPLCQALKDKHANVRKEVVVALGKLGDQRAIVPIIDAAEDRTAGVRAEVVRVLRQWNGPSVEQALIELAHDTNEPVCCNAVISLGMMRGGAAIAALQELFFRVPHQSLRGSPTLWTLIFEALSVSGKLDLTDSHFRARVLRSITDEHCLSYTRVWALDAVGKHEPVVVYQALSSSNLLVREKAAEIVGELGDQEAIPLLIPLLNDPSPSVQLAVVASLRALHATGAVERLVQLFMSLDPERWEWRYRELFVNVIETIVHLDVQALNTEHTLNLLEEIAGNKEYPGEMRRIAVTTHYKLTDRVNLDKIRLDVQSHDDDTWIPAVQILGMQGDSKNFELLSQVLQKKMRSDWLAEEQQKILVEALVRVDQQQAITFFLARLHRQQPPIALRMYIQTLVELKATQAIQPLRRLVHHPHPDERVQEEVLSALAKLENSNE